MTAKRFALVGGGLVHNIIRWDGTSPLDIGDLTPIEQAEDSPVSIGWTHDGTNFAPPPVPIPPPAPPEIVASCYCSVTGSPPSITSMIGSGILSASRVGVGRIRFYFAVQQPDAFYVASCTPRQGTDATFRVNNQTRDYVEIMTNKNVQVTPTVALVSVEAAGYNLIVTRG